MRNLDLQLLDEIFLDSFVQLSIFGRQVSHDAGLNNCETKVHRFVGDFCLLDQCPIPCLLQQDLKFILSVVFIDIDGIELHLNVLKE